MPQIRECLYEHINALTLENDVLCLTVLPALGAKVISIVHKADGHEYLWRQPDRPLRLPPFGAEFTDYDISGWDECFPTIYPVDYPEEPWRGIPVPDHGEVWALPWRWEYADGELRMWTHSVRFGYRFERAFSLDNGTLKIRYLVNNPTAFALKALWSMHPFFRATPQTRILLPDGTRIRVEASDNDHLGSYLSEHAWPSTTNITGEACDLSLLGQPREGTNSKLFTTRLSAGWAALFEPVSEHYIAFTFDSAEVPYVGICTLRGGWPSIGAKAFTLILEPCNGWPDRLDTAVNRGDHVVVPAESSYQWQVQMHLGQGAPGLERLVGPITIR